MVTKMHFKVLKARTVNVIDIVCTIIILCNIDLLRYHNTSCIRGVTQVLLFQKI